MVPPGVGRYCAGRGTPGFGDLLVLIGTIIEEAGPRRPARKTLLVADSGANSAPLPNPNPRNRNVHTGPVFHVMRTSCRCLGSGPKCRPERKERWEGGNGAAHKPAYPLETPSDQLPPCKECLQRRHVAYRSEWEQSASLPHCGRPFAPVFLPDCSKSAPGYPSLRATRL